MEGCHLLDQWLVQEKSRLLEEVQRAVVALDFEKSKILAGQVEEIGRVSFLVGQLKFVLSKGQKDGE